MSLSNKLDALIPFLEIRHNCIISKSGDCTVAFELTKPALFSLAAPDMEALHQAWVKAIRVLPYPSVIHCQDWYTRSNYKADFEKDDDSFLARASERFFHERPFLSHRSFCFLTRKFGSRRPPTSALSSLLRPSLVPEFILRPAQLKEFLDQDRKS